MRYPTIEHHSASEGVTGSCHQLHMDATSSLLVDCGLFQGSETSADGRASAGQLAIEFALQTIKAQVVTHEYIGSLLMPPVSPERADILVLESTYGDRLHEDRTQRRQRLKAVIEHALQDKSTVLIPAFSIGRSQELLYELEEIIHDDAQLCAGAATATEGRAGTLVPTSWPTLPIILDSPLATRFTEAYRSLKPYCNHEARERVEAGRNPLTFDNLITIDSHADHIAVLNHLIQTARPAIVIAGNGMCLGGRIVNYLKAMLHDPRHDVLFVGYQSRGTPGHAIQQYGPRGGLCRLGRRTLRRPDKGNQHRRFLGACRSAGGGGVRDGDGELADGYTDRIWGAKSHGGVSYSTA